MPNPSVSWFQSSGSSTRTTTSSNSSNSNSSKIIIQRLIVLLLGIFAKPLVVFILVVWILPAAISWGHYWNWLTANQCVLVSYHHHPHHHPSGGSGSGSGGVAVERYCHGLSSSSSSTTKSSKNTYYYASSSIMHQVPTLLELSDFLSASPSRTTTTTTTTAAAASTTTTKAAPMLGTTNDVGILIEWDGTGWKSSSNTDEAKKITTLERTTTTTTTNTAGTRTTTNPLATRSSSASSSRSSIINFAPPAPILEEKEETSEKKKKKDDSAQTAYGFRRNDHQRQNGNHNARRGRPRPFIPVTTGILLAINLGMFLWLWNNNNSNSNSSNNTIGRVVVVPMMDPCPRDVVVVVSLNQDVYHDFGRSITGHLSHFEAWHIGFNMMTLSALGPSLEEYYGSLPLLLWTISFLPITTLVVLGLFHLLRRSPPTRRLCGCCSSSSSSSSSSTTTTTTTTTTATADSTSIISPSFPSMVGFSGILFAWMVVSTLLNDGQRSCPVIFLPNLCFDTFELLLPGGGDGNANANAVRVSWAPLVQLVVLQVILPRVSFLGHLAGIVVGFLWHWRIFPSLEWMQPCILFPVLWMGGKYYYYHYYYHYHWYYFQTSPFPTSGETTTTSTATPIITGSSSSSSSSRSSNARGKSRRLSDDFPATLRQLTLLRNILVVHWIFQLQQLGLHCFFSGTVAELLLIVILFGLIHIGRKQQQQSCKEEYEQKQQKQQQQQQQERNEQLLLLFGVVGRGYIFLVLVMMVTDGLTLGAWLATWSLWANSLMASLLLLSRNMVFLLSISLTVHAFVIVGDEAEACCSSSTTSTSTASTSTTSRGGSFGILLWPLVRQMQPLGKWLEQQQRRSGIQQFVLVVIAGSLCRLLGAEFRGRTSTPATEHPPEGGSRTEEAVHYDHSSATTTSELV